MKKVLIFLVVALWLPKFAHAVYQVPSVAAMVASPTPAVGTQFYITGTGQQYIYTGSGNYGCQGPFSNPSAGIKHHVQGVLSGPTPTLLIPASSTPGVTSQIVGGRITTTDATASVAFHIGNSATPTDSSTVLGQCTFPANTGTNVGMSQPIPVQTPNAPSTMYMDGTGKLQWDLDVTYSNGQ